MTGPDEDMGVFLQRKLPDEGVSPYGFEMPPDPFAEMPEPWDNPPSPELPRRSPERIEAELAERMTPEYVQRRLDEIKRRHRLRSDADGYFDE